MMNTEENPLTAEEFRNLFSAIRSEVQKLIVGQTEIIDGILMCLVTSGHVLLEGVPGLGKTMLVRTLASALSLTFNRIQFTPDLMPADITGTNILSEDESGVKRFNFQPGPIFGQLILADEINRATPKTQSAMLEAMQEGSVTVAGTTYQISPPFCVLATQNPIDMEGTYPLPEAQLDRFMFKLFVGSPNLPELGAIIGRTTSGEFRSITSVATEADLGAMRKLAEGVPIASHVLEHASRLLLATHPSSEFSCASAKRYVQFGPSVRGGQALVRAAKVMALLNGRFNVSYDDINAVAPASLRHRILLNFDAETDGVGTHAIVLEAVKEQTQLSKRVAI